MNVLQLREKFPGMSWEVSRELMRRMKGLEVGDSLMLREAISDYLLTDQLQDYRPYPKQRNFHSAGRVFPHRMLSANNQGGKAVVNGTPVPTERGMVAVEELRVGDWVYGSGGRRTRVLGVFPQGERDVYRVGVSDGAELVVCGEHLWTVRRNTGRRGVGRWVLKTTEELIERAKGGTRYDLPRRPVLRFPDRELVVEPYLLGLLIGDGSLSGSGVGLTTADEEIVQYCADVAHLYGCEFKTKGIQGWFSRARSSGGNPLMDRLRRLGLMGCKSEAKRVPHEYLWADPVSRLSLVRGLMDSDGTIGSKGRAYAQRTYSTVSRGLADDMVWLLRSLGVQCEVKGKKGRYQGRVHYSWRVAIRCGGPPLFMLPRKRERERHHERPARNMLIRSIKGAGRDLCTCIRVEAEDGLFVAGEGLVVTHNSWSSGAETAMHLTGEYPDWWDGLRFHEPITAWACGDTADAVRDNPQRVLIGQVGREGTGLVPKRCLTGKKAMAKGVGSLLDYIRIRHASGGTSLLRFRYYAQDRTAWQGPPVNWMWLDEEPPEEMYQEGMARLFGVSGKSILSYTPILGRTSVTLRYVDPHVAGNTRHLTRMTIFDSQHIPREEAEKRERETPEHERPARIYGLPSAGEGAVFPIADRRILVEPFDIPDAFERLGGLDFGWSLQHPTAAVEIARDPNTDTVYVIQEYRESQRTAEQHCIVLRKWHSRLRFAWPKDGESVTAGSEGIAVAQLYRDSGLLMLREHAQFLPTDASRRNRQSVVSHERGVQEMSTRMQDGRLKVFTTCRKLMEEKRQYHRKDSKIVKKEDDLLDALRYTIMMLRYGRSRHRGDGALGEREAPNWKAI